MTGNSKIGKLASLGNRLAVCRATLCRISCQVCRIVWSLVVRGILCTRGYVYLSIYIYILGGRRYRLYVIRPCVQFTAYSGVFNML